MPRPRLTLLDEPTVRRILDEAVQLLGDPGVRIHSERALALLDGAGARIDRAAQAAHLPAGLVERCLATAPRRFALYTTLGEPAVQYAGDEVHFDPGSAAIEILDYKATTARAPVTRDLIRAAQLADRLPEFDAVSTCLVPSDVPERIGDLYRLLICLTHSTKPIITGAFGVESWRVMRDMLVAVRGSAAALRAQPLAVFDVCPSPPLLWSDFIVENLIDCAEHGIPAEMISMPLSGATAPVTLIGSVVQHAAESLSGIVIHQTARPGSPIVWGGAALPFDMRTGATPMGAMETALIDAAYTQVGKSLGLPTHAYLGSSDAKIADAQAGFESAMGTLVGALAGVNMISGGGALDFERCFSLEKLVLDAEQIAMARRMLRGIRVEGSTLGLDVIRAVGHAGNFLAHPHTRDHYRQEISMPSAVVDRDSRLDWEAKGCLDATDRAHQRAEALIAGWQPPLLSPDVAAELERITVSAARAAGMDRLPGREIAEGSGG